MRLADATTLFRTALIFLVAYLVLIKFPGYVTVAIIAIAMLLDAVDGYFAVWEVSKGKVGFARYVRGAALGDKKAREEIHKYKLEVSKVSRFGARIDIAGDRVAEYVLWILFTYLHLIPLIILLLVVVRHSFADAFMGAKGTSSKMKSKFANIVYKSNASRGAINIVKFLTFGYLVLEFVYSYPMIIGYALVGILFTFIMLRGAAEIYESILSDRE